MNRKTWLVLALGLAFGASSAMATSFAGGSSGAFTNPVPDGLNPSWNISGSHFEWGIGMGTPSSSLDFTGTLFGPVSEETMFKVGTLDFYNGTIESGSGASAVDLAIALAFTSPTGVTEYFMHTFQLLNTPNVGWPEEQADIVYLPNAYSADLFELDGTIYTLKLIFGEVTNCGGFSEADRLFAYEGYSAKGAVYGVITANIPCTPDGGATLMLLGLALSSFYFGRRMFVRS